MKTCPTCNEEKPLSEFYKHADNHNKPFKYCKLCDIKRVKKWQEENKDVTLTRLYGITTKDFDDMLSDQCGRCAICGTHFESSRTTHIDHNHTTGKVRSLLCQHCNHLLGKAKDSVQILENAVHYLKYHQSKE